MADRTIAAAAEELGLKFTWVRDKVTARAIPHHRYGRNVRFTDEDIAEIRAMFKEEVAKPVPALRSVRAA